MSQQTEDGLISFIHHMRGVNEEGLRNYANLIYSGLAKVPATKPRVEDFKLQLLPWVSRCADCNEPVGEGFCPGCAELYQEVWSKADQSLQEHGTDGFCCLELEGLPYRKTGGLQ